MASPGSEAVAGTRARSALAAVYLTVFLDLLGFGIILPLLPFYAERFGATGVWVGALLTAYSAAQFVGAPVLGRLSDRVGRRPVLLLSLAGSAVSLAATGLARGLGVLLLARACAGLFGGSIATAQAYIADVTAPRERARYMGLLGAAIGLGFVFGPALGSLLAPRGFGSAAFAAAGLAAGNWLLAFFRLPESRRPGAGNAPRTRLSAEALRRAAERPSVARLLAATFLTVLAFVSMEATFALLGERRFGLGERNLGLVFTYVGVVIVVVQGGLIGRLARRFGERTVAVAGSVVMALALAALPHAPALGPALLVLGGLALGQGLVNPCQATLLSREGGEDERGGLLGLGQSLGAAARGVGPLLAGWLFDRSAWLPYAAAAVSMLASTVLLLGLAEAPASASLGE
jgi:DHA1 family tetracycline resistance protein-like MFS transporter